MNSNGFPEVPAPGFSAAPPPPPPPPVPGQVPALRISTASEASPRRAQPSGPQDPYEPPAAIQNAMMTKDKKPFTYTPGMGGKLDLSQIRSPRMARRVAKNAEDEGIEGPPKEMQQQPRSPQQGLPGQPGQGPIYSHPQVAVPVFPQNIPQQPAVNLRNTVPRAAPAVVERQDPPPPRPTVKVDQRMPTSVVDYSSPSPPTSPTQVTLAKAPTPWMQKPTKQPAEVPEWAKKAPTRPNEIQFDDDVNAMMYQQQSPSQQPKHRPVQPPVQQQFIPQHQMRQIPQETKFVVPRIEDRPSVFTAMNDGNSHHQLMNSNPHHQSRWGNPIGQSATPVQQTQGGAYIIPVQIEGQSQYYNSVPSPASNGNHHPPQFNRSTSRGYAPPSPSQMEPGPVQSKSFRVLQKITDTDADQVDGEQLRKLQLTDDDRYLMDKFKEQVDGENYLHQVEDPRYRGAAIPSRAFRYLQNMTDSSDLPVVNNSPKPVNSTVKKPNSTVFVEVPVVQHIPASQQQVPEPKKYTGGAIPSRSFRILQAMTAPESVGSQWESNEAPMTSSSTEQPIYTSYSPIFYINSENNSETKPEAAKETRNNQCSIFLEKRGVDYYGAEESKDSIERPDKERGESDEEEVVQPKEEFEEVKEVEREFHEEIKKEEDREKYIGEETEEDEEESDEEIEKKEEENDLDEKTEEDEESNEKIEEDEEEFDEEIEEQESDEDYEKALSKEDLKKNQEDSDQEIEEEFETDEENEAFEQDQEEKYVDNEENNFTSDEDESSSSGSDSESYLAYVIRQSSLNEEEESDNDKFEEHSAEGDSTDCEKENILEDDVDEDSDDLNTKTYENDIIKTCDDEEKIIDSEIDESTSLKLKLSNLKEKENVMKVTINKIVKDDETTEKSNFIPKKPYNQSESFENVSLYLNQPTLVVTSTEANHLEPTKTQLSSNHEENGKTLLNVWNNSKEEITDDEDSGVTSDVSRIISEVDSDSEYCSQSQKDTLAPKTLPTPPPRPAVKRAQKVYNRTQTHSRLFRLLSDEHMRLPNGTPTSPSDPSDLTLPDVNARLPARPRSLNCEALFRQQEESQSWRSNDKTVTANPQLTRPRVGVYCPRTRSGKNLPQIMRIRQQQPSSRSRIPPSSLRY